MSFSKVSLAGPSYTALPPETAKNRFEKLDLNKQTTAIQPNPSCLDTALKVLLAVPRFLIGSVIFFAACFKKGASIIFNCLTGSSSSSRNVTALTPTKTEEAPTKKIYSEPILGAGKSVSSEPVEAPKKEKVVTVTFTPSVEEGRSDLEDISETQHPVTVDFVDTPDQTDVSEEVVSNEEVPVTSTKTTLEEDCDNWELDLDNPGQVHVTYPEPSMPAAPKSGTDYLTPIAAVTGFLGLTALGYGIHYMLGGSGGGSGNNYTCFNTRNNEIIANCSSTHSYLDTCRSTDNEQTIEDCSATDLNGGIGHCMDTNTKEIIANCSATRIDVYTCTDSNTNQTILDCKVELAAK